LPNEYNLLKYISFLYSFKVKAIQNEALIYRDQMSQTICPL